MWQLKPSLEKTESDYELPRLQPTIKWILNTASIIVPQLLNVLTPQRLYTREVVPRDMAVGVAFCHAMLWVASILVYWNMLGNRATHQIMSPVLLSWSKVYSSRFTKLSEIYSTKLDNPPLVCNFDFYVLIEAIIFFILISLSQHRFSNKL